MKPTTKEKVKKFLTPLVESIMREEESPRMLDPQELKVISQYVNGLSAVPSLRHSINDKTILNLADKVNSLRMEIMEYVEQNSNYKFYGKSPQGWKLVKK